MTNMGAPAAAGRRTSDPRPHHSIYEPAIASNLSPNQCNVAKCKACAIKRAQCDDESLDDAPGIGMGGCEDYLLMSERGAAATAAFLADIKERAARLHRTLEAIKESLKGGPALPPAAGLATSHRRFQASVIEFNISCSKSDQSSLIDVMEGDDMAMGLPRS